MGQLYGYGNSVFFKLGPHRGALFSYLFLISSMIQITVTSTYGWNKPSSRCPHTSSWNPLQLARFLSLELVNLVSRGSNLQSFDVHNHKASTITWLLRLELQSFFSYDGYIVNCHQFPLLSRSRGLWFYAYAYAYAFRKESFLSIAHAQYKCNKSQEKYLAKNC